MMSGEQKLSQKMMRLLETWMTADEAEVQSLKAKLLPGLENLKFAVIYRPSIEAWEVTARRPEMRDPEAPVRIGDDGSIWSASGEKP